MTSALPQACRGASSTGAIWWQSGAWVVIPYGMQQIDGPYSISAGSLADCDSSGQLRWIGTMDAIGLDLDDFLQAFAVALVLHGHHTVDPALVPASAKAWRKGLRRQAYEASLKAAERARSKLRKPRLLLPVDEK